MSSGNDSQLNAADHTATSETCNGVRPTALVEFDRDVSMPDVLTSSTTRFGEHSPSGHARVELPQPAPSVDRTHVSMAVPASTNTIRQQGRAAATDLLGRYAAILKAIEQSEAQNNQLVDENKRIVQELSVYCHLLGSNLPANWAGMIRARERLSLLQIHNNELFHRHATFQAGDESLVRLRRDHEALAMKNRQMVARNAALEDDYRRLSQQPISWLSDHPPLRLICAAGEIVDPYEIIAALRPFASFGPTLSATGGTSVQDQHPTNSHNPPLPPREEPARKRKRNN